MRPQSIYIEIHLRVYFVRGIKKSQTIETIRCGKNVVKLFYEKSNGNSLTCGTKDEGACKLDVFDGDGGLNLKSNSSMENVSLLIKLVNCVVFLGNFIVRNGSFFLGKFFHCLVPFKRNKSQRIGTIFLDNFVCTQHFQHINNVTNRHRH